MNFYTADLHFGHQNAIAFDHRPYATVEEMNATLIHNWNAVVGEEDHTYILGDFSFRSSEAPVSFLRQLRGHKHLIQGNHDGAALNDPAFLESLDSVDKMLFVQDEGRNVVLCHFPIAEWNGMRRGAYHLYGHIHNDKDTPTRVFMATLPRAFNVGCMLHNYTPVTLTELIWERREAEL